MKKRVVLRVNGEDHEVFIRPNRTLLEVLRQDLHLRKVLGRLGKASLKFYCIWK
jgi:aerobic-type carbon monoxide dehydrogenase small subunit (CoxS/CutS family)